MYEFVAPCLFGLEGLVADELRQLGCEPQAENGRVRFSGPDEMTALANIHLSCAERVLLVVGEFHAETFDELFEGTKALPWEDFIPSNGAFPVKGFSMQSKLFGVSGCQSIIKKAMVERLKQVYGIEWFAETGEKLQIQFSIMKDQVMLMIDTSGEGLHKRGYRREANDAPLKETLAAAMVKLARYRPDFELCDPMCGSGTILIEAARAARQIAPGLTRPFAAEGFSFLADGIFRDAREAAKARIQKGEFIVQGFDIDQNSVELTARNAALAGVGEQVRAAWGDVKDLSLARAKGMILTNPPYGERMGDQEQCEQLYRTLGKVFPCQEGWYSYILCSHPEFERFYGRRADRRRKLYNGMIPCQLYMYFKNERI